MHTEPFSQPSASAAATHAKGAPLNHAAVFQLLVVLSFVGIAAYEILSTALRWL